MARYAEDILGAVEPSGVTDPVTGKPVRYAEDILGPDALYDTKMQGSYWDTFFSSGSPGTVLDSFNRGYKQAYGQQPLGFSKDTEKTLKDLGIFNDFEKGQHSIVRGFNEELLRPLAIGVDYAMRSAYATARGLAATADAQNPLAAAPFAIAGAAGAAAFEAFPFGHYTGFPHLTPFDAARDLRLLPDSAGVARDAAVDALNPRQGGPSDVYPARPDPNPPAGTVPPTTPTTDATGIYLRARDYNPEAWQKYDALNEQRQTFQEWINDLRTRAPESDTIGEREIPASTPLNKVEEVLGRKLDEREAETLQKDTANVALIEKLRRDVAELDKQIADVVPDIKESYDAVRGPAETAPIETRPPITFEITEPLTVDVTSPPEMPPGVEAREPATVLNLSQRRPTILQDVARQVIDAGRPVEEARSVGAIWQAYYEAKAARFEGALGTARDLYDKEAPDIRSAGKAGPRGALNLADNTITLMRDADPSTMIHETGHVWLEDMLRDGQRPEAPPDLLEDLNAVKAYLGMDTTNRPTRAQHEKFARSFERYVMEGVAPTPRLAGVFEKFRNWLTSLYQTVSRLKAPINDDIRAVFDRLLVGPKDKVTLAPEREVGMNFAEVHEADVATAEPVDALTKADEVLAERETIAQILNGEIESARQRARAAKRPTSTEIAGGNERVAVPERGRTAGGNDTVREEAVSEPPEVSPSRASIKTKSDPAGGPRDTGLVDKAGNIRIELLDAPDDIDEVIRTVASNNNDFTTQRRGVISDGQALDLSDALGIDPAFLDRKAVADAWSFEEILAARRLLVESASSVRDRMADVSATAGGPQAAIALAESIARHEMIQGKVSAATANWGRAGRALRSLKNFEETDIDALNTFLRENTGRSYDQLFQMAKLGKMLNQAQVSKFVNDTSAGKLKRAVLYYWTNSLISGPVTHSVYAIGNELRAVWHAGVESPVAATIGSIREAAGLDAADRVHWQEVAASWRGLGKGSMDAWKPAYEAWKTGQQVQLPGQRGFISGYPGQFLSPYGNPVMRALGIPGRSISAIHSFFSVIRYEQRLSELAARTALEEGLTGDAYATRVAKLREWPADPLMTTALQAQASDYAMTELFMRSGDYMSKRNVIIRNLLQSNLPMQILVPFAKVGVEIQRETFIKQTPLGMLDKEVRNALLMREGGAAFDEAAARQFIGMGLLGSGIYLASAGYMNGYGPADPAQRPAWLLTHQPYSIHIGPLQIPFSGLGPVGNVLKFGADAWETGHYWDGKDREKLVYAWTKTVGRAAFEESVFRDLGEINDVINDPERHAGRFINNWVSSWLPFSAGLGQVNRALFDPYSKDIHGLDIQTIFDGIRARIPGASWNVQNRIDLFGNPVLARPGAVQQATGSVESLDRYTNDPAAVELNKLGVKIGHLDRKIMGVEIEPHDFEHYSIMAGQLSHKMLLAAVQTPGYQSAPNGVKMEMLSKVIEGARAQARAALIMEAQRVPGKSILEKAIALQREKLK